MIKYDLSILDEMEPEQLIMELHPYIQQALAKINIAYFRENSDKLRLVLQLSTLFQNLSMGKLERLVAEEKEVQKCVKE